ncbi:hypothetical protein [Aminobacter carboxidus]|uniref:Uncharacterized protein n=1 Tax=Aminobacter carboxidus TaxID=376165 RepID=A0ABR9GUF3_9HYPH|nr:hypothetical protein [Aminobacter carboxidus]MBE1207316.1 hypothetical protein [Aminobacter carboxidus]
MDFLLRYQGVRMVGVTGIEPVTPAMSMQCSPDYRRCRSGERLNEFNCLTQSTTFLGYTQPIENTGSHGARYIYQWYRFICVFANVKRCKMNFIDILINNIVQ